MCCYGIHRSWNKIPLCICLILLTFLANIVFNAIENAGVRGLNRHFHIWGRPDIMAMSVYIRDKARNDDKDYPYRRNH